MNIFDAPVWECNHQHSDLPRTRTFKYFEPEPGGCMDFRLIYKGSLPAAASGKGGSRAKDKHQLRKHFHKQLRELWKQHPDLRRQSESRYYSLHGSIYRTVAPDGKTWVEHLADNHQRCGGRFVPLVTKEGGFTCSLDILFLRRDNPGNLIASGGDIDNRIKVLIDGLRMPDVVTELGGLPFDSDENPFYCVLEDDALITQISVTTDRLLTPLESDEAIHDVELVIRVSVVNPSAIFGGGRLV